MSGIGHNRGPTLEPGSSWRRHCWTKARRDLLPAMPLEVINARMKRAAELGLDYRTYAGLRATTGRDIIAFLFSSNALRLTRTATLPEAHARKLESLVDCRRLGAIYLPVDPREVLRLNAEALDHAGRAPTVADSWSGTRSRLLAIVRQAGVPADAIAVVGETALEKDWCATLRMAGHVPAQGYFGSVT